MKAFVELLLCCLLASVSCQRLGGNNAGFRGGGRGPQNAGLDAPPADPSGEGTAEGLPAEEQPQQRPAAARQNAPSSGQRFRAQQVRQRPQFTPAAAPPPASQASSEPSSDTSRTRTPVFAGSRGPQFDRIQPSNAPEESSSPDSSVVSEPVDVPRSRRPSQRPSPASNGSENPQRRPTSSPFSRRPPQSSSNSEATPEEEQPAPAARVPEPPRQRPIRPKPSPEAEDPASADGEFVSECPISDGFFADAYECDRYYECRNNQITEHVCKDGLAFNDYSVKFGRCDFTFNVDCSDRPNLQPAQPTPNCPRANGYFAHPDPTKCTEFFFCTDGTANPITCPGGLIFDPKKGQCAWPEDAKRKGCGAADLWEFTCPPQTSRDAAVQQEQHPRFPDPKDCQFFYLCIDGVTPRRSGCPLGRVFNDATGSCDDPNNVPDCADWYKDDPRVKPTTTTTTTRRPAPAGGSTSTRLRPNRTRLPSRRRPAAPAAEVNPEI